MATLSPMMQQYMSIKEKNPDTLLFFRVGDFYEMFFEDAVTASRELELVLTGKDCGLEERAPMAGVPFHAVDAYVSRLIEKGYRVAICEQMEDPALAKGLVQRDIIRIITPGTLMDSSVIGERNNNFLCSVYITGKRAGISYCDVSTGEFYAMQTAFDAAPVSAQIAAIAPGEIICNDVSAFSSCCSAACTAYLPSAYQQANAREALLSHFGMQSLVSLGIDQAHSAAMCAAGALMKYLSDTQKNSLEHITTLRMLDTASSMPLDAATRRNLELTETIRGKSKKGSLLDILDKTVTAMGGRMLRSFVEKPLISKEQIEERLNAVEALYGDFVISQELRDRLSNVYDMERLLSKVSYHTINAKDCLSLLRSLEQAPDIRSLLSSLDTEALRPVTDRIDTLDSLRDLLSRAISPDCPLQITDGGVIKEGFSQELDEYRRAGTEGKTWLAELEAREREKTGIKSLKVQYNRVFGYYIEVTKSFYSLVPAYYVRKQTLTNAERFTTEELHNIEIRITGAQDSAMKLELQLFDSIRSAISENMVRLQSLATAYKLLDAFLSLAQIAREYHYTRPVINTDGIIDIKEGRHPVVERNLPDNAFVPNDTLIDRDERRMQIITGPNMAGKSTYMRQVALICLMAHMGSFVPAREASIPVLDAVFTRVGASDDLAAGESTFMVEMSETAYIMRNATQNSLVILDEIGRGTSTFDGLSIAWAAVEYLADKKHSGAKTLFATHYHELSELEGHLEGVVNYCVAVKEHGEEVIFLRKIVPGGADKSFGIYVARLAGLPRSVIARAQEIEARLEVNNINQNSIGQNILGTGHKAKNQQVDLLSYTQTEFVEEIRSIDVLAMTPMEALNKMFLIHEKAMKL